MKTQISTDSFLGLVGPWYQKNDKRCELFKTMNSKQNFPFLYAFFLHFLLLGVGLFLFFFSKTGLFRQC